MTGQLTIQPLDKSQLEQAVKLLCAVFNKTAAVTRKDIVSSFSGDPAAPVTLAACVEGEVVGLVRYQEYAPQLYVGASLAVDPAFRGRGIARQLARAVETRISAEVPPGKEGMIIIQDGTKERNPASTFYEDMGATPIKMDGIGEGDAPALMKMISPKAPSLRR